MKSNLETYIQFNIIWKRRSRVCLKPLFWDTVHRHSRFILLEKNMGYVTYLLHILGKMIFHCVLQIFNLRYSLINKAIVIEQHWKILYLESINLYKHISFTDLDLKHPCICLWDVKHIQLWTTLACTCMYPY